MYRKGIYVVSGDDIPKLLTVIERFGDFKECVYIVEIGIGRDVAAGRRDEVFEVPALVEKPCRCVTHVFDRVVIENV